MYLEPNAEKHPYVGISIYREIVFRIVYLIMNWKRLVCTLNIMFEHNRDKPTKMQEITLLAIQIVVTILNIM